MGRGGVVVKTGVRVGRVVWGRNYGSEERGGGSGQKGEGGPGDQWSRGGGGPRGRSWGGSRGGEVREEEGVAGEGLDRGVENKERGGLGGSRGSVGG